MIYKDMTYRTFVRELSRLDTLGFIKFARGGSSKSLNVELDFGENAKYPVS